ncbi:Hemolysin, contains CBS domains [Eubacterium pyruvativorans]|uniref:Hemolysin, contains CBS domains n=1 Tax=Eubacterium pyruvativorans TaxID=155865 RepID=A0A1I7H239_9FIRM|nr:hemolysin family protein [Eubacterium pyruvativorans]MCI5747507.1 hemolysin family protein [Eubacterium pyruvativorans]MDD7684458.1 hemolysin family protein [Eubacterium pyruvativorans]MDY4049663.1 hemolysin family protein [Eubacterium pyruvativorans]SFO19758.1 Hemolysin, contains CBS domains [Eubacterium pyruvativorans]SFU54753.1 Hemolysin, contains CBS domains [Eubacterium pyruvativorans]
MGIDIIVIIVLVICSAFFSATETAFTSANRIRLKNMANDGNRRAETALALIERYDELLSTILVGNNIANTANTAVATGVFVALYGHYGTVLSTVVMTLVVLVFGEVTPKTLAKEYPESVAMSTASLIHGLMILFTPVNWVFSSWKKLLLHAAKGSEHNITEDELITIVEEAETEGSIPSDHSELIQNAIEFDGIEAWDVLTPRVEIEAVDIEMSKQEIADLFLKTGFSRLPVYEDDLDRILGVLNQKDFHNYIYHSAGTVAEYIKPVVFCAGSMKAFALLQMMQHRKCQIAIVIDEYGGTTGLVAMEDIIEELVGEIYDEHENVGTREITPLQDGSYRVLGLANLSKLFDYFDEDEKVDAVTVNGWVVRELDHLPKVGDTFTYETRGKLFRGRVMKADDRKALEINLRVEDKEEEED